MKLAFLILGCFVAVSYQQNSFAPTPVVNSNLPQQPYPYAFPKSNSEPSQVVSPRSGKGEEHEEHKDDDKDDHHSGIYQAVEAILHSQHQEHKHKFKVVTETVHKTHDAIIKGVLISTELCVNHKLFSTSYKGLKPHVLDKPCLVEKHEDDDDHKEHGHHLTKDFSPSRVVPFEASREPVVVFEDQSSIPFNVFKQLLSSKEEHEHQKPNGHGSEGGHEEKPRPPHHFDPYRVTVFVTAHKTKTHYELKQKKVQRTVNLADRPGVLACLPEGHVICHHEHREDEHREEEHREEEKRPELDVHGGAPAPVPLKTSAQQFLANYYFV